MEGLSQSTWNPARQCTATNRAGDRCGRQPIPGGDVCVLHGGAIPQVRAAAEKRLLALREPVLTAFEEILNNWHATRCTTCGLPTGDPSPVIRLGQIILDRTGHHPTLAIRHEQPAPDRYARYTDDQVIEKLETMLTAARERRDLHRRAQLPEVIDGEFVVPGDEKPAEPAWSSPCVEVTIRDESAETPKENVDE